MLFQNSVSPRAAAALALVCAMGIILSGGCPQQQVPNQPSDPNEDVITPPNDNEGNGGTDRPTPPPVIDEPNDADPNDGGGGGDGDGNGDGDGGDGSGNVILRFDAPLEAAALRPGTPVPFEFRLLDSEGQVTSAQLLLARDDNADGTADGPPVASIPVGVTAGSNSINLDTNLAVPYLVDGYGRFLLGVQYQVPGEQPTVKYAPGVITLDAVPPEAEWVSPDGDNLVNPTFWTVQLRTVDNSMHTIRVLLDDDMSSANGFAGVLVGETELPAGDSLRTFIRALDIEAGTYYYYVTISDGIEPMTEFYAPNLKEGGGFARLGVTNRAIGSFDLNRLDPAKPEYDNFGASTGAIFQGFNYNDLAGSSMDAVPDINGDGFGELVVAARFGKPYIAASDGVGFGEAYLLYGNANRLRGVRSLNSIGYGSVPGLIMPGIRSPLGTYDNETPDDPTDDVPRIRWTHGLADVTVIPDMDGDDLPELVYSFPRCESVSIGVENPEDPNVPPVQSVLPDIVGMGSLEYDAFQFIIDPNDPNEPTYKWLQNTAQFTRGGVVIVSSHSPLLQIPSLPNRKGNRVLDLAEVGQLFDSMVLPGFRLYIKRADEEPGPQSADCDGTATDYENWTVGWDVAFTNQGPGGFETYLTSAAFQKENSDPNAPLEPDPYQPSLAPRRPMFFPLDDFDTLFDTQLDPCAEGNCVRLDAWYSWGVLPGTYAVGLPSWHDALEEFDGELYPSYYSVWTGFYGRETARVSPLWEVGCRVLGERREDRFGTSVGSNGDWLYVSAPDRTARVIDGIPDLAADRSGAGVVYQIRTNAVFGNSSATRTQLWIEYGTQTVEDPNDPNLTIDVDVAWPNPDVQIPDREDWSMPVPHQYIIGLGGSIRGEDTNFSGSNLTSVGDGDRLVEYNFTGTGCLNGLTRTVQAGPPADAIRGDSYPAYGPGRSSWYLTDELWYIVGPHIGSHLSHVRGLEDVNDDGLPDFAVGSGDVYEDFTYPDAPSGAIVGGVFIVFSREAGVSGSYLLDRIALPPAAGGRLRGVFLRGSSAGEKLGRVFDSAGDMNGDGVGDVIVGSEGSDSSRGKAIVVLGSRTLESPAGGWTVSDIVEAGHAVLFRGVDPNDLAGANVAGAGDVDGDGYDDILIAAPGANQGRGVVYLIYGSFGLAGEYSLADVGTLALPGCVYLGRGPTDALGGGRLVFDALDSSAERQFFLNPGDPGAPYPQRVEVYSRGVARLGDLDNDGRDEYSISAMLADVNGRVDSGEVYVLYGRGD